MLLHVVRRFQSLVSLDAGGFFVAVPLKANYYYRLIEPERHAVLSVARIMRLMAVAVVRWE